MVVANKIDLENRTVVGAQDGQAFAQSIGFEFFQVSASKGTEMDAPFKYLVNTWHQIYQEKVNQLQNM